MGWRFQPSRVFAIRLCSPGNFAAQTSAPVVRTGPDSVHTRQDRDHCRRQRGTSIGKLRMSESEMFRIKRTHSAAPGCPATFAHQALYACTQTKRCQALIFAPESSQGLTVCMALGCTGDDTARAHPRVWATGRPSVPGGPGDSTPAMTLCSVFRPIWGR
jgi:hypothetical protein